MDPDLSGDRNAFDDRLEAVVSASEAAVATAQALQEDLARFSRPATLVPNGCTGVAPTPARTGSGSFPTGAVGYLGTIDQRVDLRILVETVALLPEVTFLIGGRVNPDRADEFTALKRAPNVEYVGQISISMADQFLAGLAVGLIPFKPGWVGDRLNPVKMSEYAAHGLPIVATDIAECRSSGVVVTADDAEEMAAAIKSALGQARPSERSLEYAKENTWAQQAATLDGVIAELADDRTVARMNRRVGA